MVKRRGGNDGAGEPHKCGYSVATISGIVFNV